MKNNRIFAIAASLSLLVSCSGEGNGIVTDKPEFGGIYPHLGYYNNEGECGTGAVVPWADRLWVVTYGPHKPWGSTDKLYEINDSLKLTIRPESVGGTPADRLIHKESGQLVIGPYFIDSLRNVRTMDYAKYQGRYTGAARHLTDPADKIYIATMEEGFYEVDVHTLDAVELYRDANGTSGKTHNDVSVNPQNDLLPGCHGKGLYSGQGCLYFSNNGEATAEALERFDVESGVLAEWDGKDWKVVRRNQFTEITGPGGIKGNPNPETDPIWALGWDCRSVLVALKDGGEWFFYRLPKASNSYDGAHGWNTEWPRIRNVGGDTPEYLMTMHGMFWHFPETFSRANTAGIRPRSSYLKIVGDFTRWHDRLVFGCDDAARNEFLNRRKAKGGVGGPGQSNSNLWFTSVDTPDLLGPANASGYVWLRDNVGAGECSEPFLFEGWKRRCAWISNDSDSDLTFRFEVDEQGNGEWRELLTTRLEAASSAFVPFGKDDPGVWIRVVADAPARTSVAFVYADDFAEGDEDIFKGLAGISEEKYAGGIVCSMGSDSRRMGMVVNDSLYELDGDDLSFPKVDDEGLRKHIAGKFAINVADNGIKLDGESVLVVDDQGRRWRLPLGDSAFDSTLSDGSARICREVVTERDLLNCHGTFYELPAENADGFAKIKPISSHNLRINDFCSYRGMLLMTGLTCRARSNPRVIRTDDGKAGVWAGTIDDLWKLGKPVGHGGPWKDSRVEAGVPSDPYLINGYDSKTLNLSLSAAGEVNVKIEVDPTGDGEWFEYSTVTLKSGSGWTELFPRSFSGRWIRFTADRDCTATALLDYE